MRLFRQISELREAIAAERRAGASIGLVPTMGALHEGHLALVRASRGQNDTTVVSIFVNPTQFGPQEDLAQYPRPFEADLELCRREGVGLVFAPEAAEMYPEGFATRVEVEQLSEDLCGRFRQGHFPGVATVVCKLLNIAQADRAYFGRKDYQQFVIVRRMAADLNIPVEIVPVPTVREPDGLALSSRNRYLSAEERSAAPALYSALQEAADAVKQGADGAQAEAIAAAALAREPLFTVQYIEAVHPETLARRGTQGAPLVIAAAAYLGNTRLIDNVKVEDTL
jgi:pantoate--beta-alanine ligase